MGFGFRKSKRLSPKVKLNVSHKSVGVSLGGKNARVSASSSGRKSASVSLGKGVTWHKSGK